MRLIKLTLLAGILLITVVVVVAWTAPTLLVRPIASYYLSAAGYELQDLTGLNLRTSHGSIAQLQLRDSNMVITAHSARFAYSLPTLFTGKLQSLEITKLDLELMASSPNTVERDTSTTQTADARLDTLLQTLSDLPLASIGIKQLTVRGPSLDLQADLQIATSPIHIAANVRSTDMDELTLQVLATTETTSVGNQVNASVVLAQNAQHIAMSEITATTVGDTLQVQSTTQLDIASLQSLNQRFSLLPELSVGIDAASLTTELTIDDLATTPMLSALVLRLDSPDHRLDVNWQSEQSRITTHLSLPIEISGAMASPDSDVALRISALDGETTYTDVDIDLANTFAFSSIELNCSVALTCTANSGFGLDFTRLNVAGIRGDNIQLNGEVEVTRADSGIVASLPLITIATTSGPLHHVESDTLTGLDITGSDINIYCDSYGECQSAGAFSVRGNTIFSSTFTADSAGMRGEFDLVYSSNTTALSAPTLTLDFNAASVAGTTVSSMVQIDNFNVSIDTQLAMSLEFSTEQLTVDAGDISLRNPALGGSVQLDHNAIQSTLDFSLANQLHALLTANYAFASGTGQLEWELPQYTFSKITPASALINQALIEGDLVSGSIAGEASVAITTDASGNMQFDGPVALTVNDLGGFVAETFFVGFSTELQAQISESGILSTAKDLSARISTLDPGVPLSNISWNYDYDGVNQQASVSNLEINTLGGQITIADFDYDIRNPNSSLTVVLTNLELQTIVDLAQYPGLAVQGLISGYIPVNITGDKITVTNGLVGALQPGGTIRYLSGNTISSGNASLDLMNQALANYHYQIMNTRVYYNENGDLRLEVQLQGNNPDLYNGQVVNLNVNIDDNIPSLLRSLQASRTITDALEQRLQSRRQSSNGQR